MDSRVEKPDPFDKLFNEHFEAVYRFLSRRLGNPEDAKDVAAETFAAALLKRCPRGVAERCWLYGIARRKLADVLRTRGETALARGVLAEARDWSGAPMLVAMVDRAGASIALSEGDVDGAIVSLRRGVGRAIATGDMGLVCELYLDLSVALLRAGDATTALHELVECIDLATLGEGFTAIDGPEPFWRILRAQAQMVDNQGDSYRALRLAEAALFHAQRVRSRLGAARVQQLLATLCDKAGLGGKAERYRAAAINEMRTLGDRRATAELLLNDTPARTAVVVPGRIHDAMQLTKEIGWTEGHERAKRKSKPPTDVKS